MEKDVTIIIYSSLPVFILHSPSFVKLFDERVSVKFIFFSLRNYRREMFIILNRSSILVYILLLSHHVPTFRTSPLDASLGTLFIRFFISAFNTTYNYLEFVKMFLLIQTLKEKN